MNLHAAATPVKTAEDWKVPLDELRARLGAPNEGLDAIEATKRLQQYGSNELPEKRDNPLLKFLSAFWGPIPFMIEAAAALAAVVHHWEDFAIISTLLIVNAIVGFWEEHQAGNAIAALKAQLALGARALRGGKWTTVPARELVPGDRIRICQGDIVPADTRLLDGDPIEVDQSVLTGESLPVTRSKEGAVYSGSIVKRGEIDGLVYATGAHTFFGKTAGLISGAHTTSHFQRAVLKIGDYLIVIALILVAVILVVALFRGEPMLTTIQFALVLTVAAIPVAMPTVLSVTMAAGARVLARKKAIVSRLAAIEELAGMDVLCSDKTGTLTQNRLTLGEPFCLEGAKRDDVLLCAGLASRVEDQDPIDAAVLGGLADPVALQRYHVFQFKPFDATIKRTEASVRAPDGHEIKVTKGAVQRILALCPEPDKLKCTVDQAVEGFAARGFRAIAVARAIDAGPWQLLGVIPLLDPPRADSKSTIKAARAMGIDVKMLTGDQIAIAREIARELDLEGEIREAETLANIPRDGDQLAEAIENARGFAQVLPEHKYQIVAALQRRGRIVGMTGDGVNDAPALKAADAGIAVSGATDAARAAADIVLLTPGLSVIIEAVTEARETFQRMTTYAIYRIAETIRVLLFMTLSILVFNFYPLTAAMIVLLALLNDGAILSIAYDRTNASPRPEAWHMRVVMGVAGVLGIAGVIASFLLFYLGERVFHIDRAMIQTLMYLKLSVAGHMTVFVARTRGPFWSIRPATILLVAVIGTQTLATTVAVTGIFMAPIPLTWALLVWGYAFAWFLVNDQIKQLAFRVFDPQAPALLLRTPAKQRAIVRHPE